MTREVAKGRTAHSGRAPDTTAPPEDRRALEALTRVSQMVAGTLDLDAVLRASIHAAAEAMDAEACSILLKDADADRMHFYLVDGPQTDGLESAAVPIDDHSIAGWVAKHRQPALVPDAYQDSRFTPSYDEKTGFRTRSVICTPLVARDGEIGVIQLLNRRDGRPFDEHDLELAGAVASLIAVAIHNAEEHEARMKAERLAVIGQTIAGMAHCVKNILNGLRAGSYILNQQLADQPAESVVSRGWKIVDRNMMLLSNIVLDMLSYCAQRRPVRQSCQAINLCQDVVNLLQEQANQKGVALAAASDIGEVVVDEASLRRCLINLVGNAIDACPAEGGQVRVEAAEAGPDRFALKVIDNGCGIEPEACEKIFDAFFSTKGGKGTGLGLAVVRKIVQEHGGEVRVASTPGAGTEFALVLPARPAEKAPGPANGPVQGAPAEDDSDKERTSP